MRPLLSLALAGLLAPAYLAPAYLTAAPPPELEPACGLDPTQLEAAAGWAFEQGTDSLIVARTGCIALERYANGAAAGKPQTVYSITKAMTAALLGIALRKGKIESLDVPVSRYFPEWNSPPRDAVTLRHLASMTSGMVDPGAAVPIGLDPFAYVRLLPLEAPPGAHWKYNNWSYRLLFPILAEAFGKPLNVLAQEELFGPLGMDRTSWVAFPQTPGDPPIYVSSSTRDVTRFGQFLMAAGAVLDEAKEPSQQLNPAYGLLLWLNREETGYTLTNGVQAKSGKLLPDAPADLIAGFGARRHKLLVSPSLNLVIVRFGEPTQGLPVSAGPDSFENQLFLRIAAAVCD